jgi:phosphatidylethanolamine/phosphatidyl-N-methylethanolamine N-methyltransferase
MKNTMSARPQLLSGARASSAPSALPGTRRARLPGPANNEAALFLARWLKAPQRIGALAPSSQYLARAMARQIDPRRDRLVVELGGGTGSITRALLETGLPSDRLIVIERDAALHAHLRARFPELRILRGDATQLVTILRALGIARVDKIVSSLPLLSMTRKARQKIVDQSFTLLGDRGALVQYTYGVASPLPGREYGIAGQVRARVWRNFPPATVWRFLKAADLAQVA